MAFIDYYKILGVDKNIPQADVQKAYRKRAKLFHPDLHPNDPKAKAKFQALSEAYEVIGDPEKRKKYDQYGERWREADAFNAAGGPGSGTYRWGGGGGQSPFEGFDFGAFGSGGFSSFFNDLFGAKRGGASRRQAGGDNGNMNANVSIDWYTAILGGAVMIQLNNGSKVKLTIKPYTQNGSKVRLRGKGYGRQDGTFGDLIITYNVKMPTTLTDHQRELLMQMQAEE